MKNIYKGIIILFLLIFGHLAYASLEINEIMYDAPGGDTDLEWIEIYNPDANAINVSNIFIADYDTTWHYHSLTSYNSDSIPAGGYALVLRTSSSAIPDTFKSKWPNYNGLIFRASFNLGNESGRLALSSDKKSVYSDVSYTSALGASGDGNSLQIISGSFVSQIPTPGSINQYSENNTSNNEENDPSQDSASDNTANLNTKIDKTYDNFLVKIVAPSIVTTKIDFKISAQILGRKREVIDSGRYVWSFGDGKSFQEAVHKPFQYSYLNKGQYVLKLSYYESILSAEPIAKEQVIITVIDPEVVISNIGNYADPYFEITNKSQREIDLSFWTIKSNTKSFIMPEGMSILPGKSIIFSSLITNFDINDIANLYLYLPNGSISAIYPDNKNTGYNKIKNENYDNTIPNINNNKNKLVPKDDEVVDLNLNTASVADSNISNNTKSIFGLFILIILGSFTLLSIHKKPSDGELDMVSASDINIIE